MSSTSKLERKSWDDFACSGMIWFVNRMLHIFGWGIVIERDQHYPFPITDVYPARTDALGFSETDDRESREIFINTLKEDRFSL